MAKTAELEARGHEALDYTSTTGMVLIVCLGCKKRWDLASKDDEPYWVGPEGVCRRKTS